MKQSLIFAFLILLMTTCEKKNEPVSHYDLANSTVNAQVIGFVDIKVYCQWGWIIKVGADTIKADSIPSLPIPAQTVFPINATIEIGSRTNECPKYNYYEILKFTQK